MENRCEVWGYRVISPNICKGVVKSLWRRVLFSGIAER
jgi:hypothetical protein